MTKIAIYTVLVGGYEEPINHHYLSPIFDHYLITDCAKVEVKGFKKILVEKEDDPKKLSRKLKLLVHNYLKEYDTYIYIDANIRITADFKKLLKHHKKDIIFKRHPRRNCIYVEGQQVINLGKDDPQTIENQLDAYRGIVKEKSGLYENGVFVRNNNEKTNKFFETWYNEIETHSYRDQISLPYVLSKTNQDFVLITNYYLNGLIYLHQHKLTRKKADRKPREKAIQVHYLTPASSDKNLGAQYNLACQNIKNREDWICLRDGDTMFLTPDWMVQIEDIIENYGEKYDLISCYTNRLGLKHQLYQGKISTDFNVYNHLKIANHLRDTYWDMVIDSPSYTAGLFMLFKVSLNDKIPFSNGLTTSNGKQIFVDADFSQRVLESGGKIGLAKGIYLFHAYRIHQPDMKSWGHLK